MEDVIKRSFGIIRFVLLAFFVVGSCEAASAQDLCRTGVAAAKLFVDSSNSVWFANGSRQIIQARFPCRLEFFDVGDVEPNSFAEDASGIWFSEYLGRNVHGKWLDEVGHIGKDRRVRQFTLGALSSAPSHAGGIVAADAYLWIAENRTLVRYEPATARAKRFYAHNFRAVLLGPALIGHDLWFIDANSLRIVAFSMPRNAFGPPVPGLPVNSGPPAAVGHFLFYSDWNTGQVTRFDARTHQRRAVGKLQNVTALKVHGNCLVVEQGSRVNVYTQTGKKLRSYDDNQGPALPGGLAVSNRYIYFSTLSSIEREELPGECGR